MSHARNRPSRSGVGCRRPSRIGAVALASALIGSATAATGWSMPPERASGAETVNRIGSPIPHGARSFDVAECQDEEIRRAALEGRPPRNLVAEVARGQFDVPERDSFVVCGPLPPWSGMIVEKDLRHALDSLDSRLHTRSVDREVSGILENWWRSRWRFIDAHSSRRRCSPAEVDVEILVHQARAARQLDPEKKPTPVWPLDPMDRFVIARRRYHEWLGLPDSRPGETWLEDFRARFTERLASLALADDVAERLRAEFDSFYDALPPRRFLAGPTVRDRRVAGYQRAENLAAADIRPARNVFLDDERGRFFAPDLEPQAAVAAWDFKPPHGWSDLDVRPTTEEQTDELAALEELCDDIGLSAKIREEIVALRRRAWETMPESIPPRFLDLLHRTPDPEELAAILDLYERRMRDGSITTPDDKAIPENQIPDRLAACREHYRGLPPRGGWSSLQARADARLNYAALLTEAGTLSADDISRRLAAFDERE